jgi:hypothetical protein
MSAERPYESEGGWTSRPTWEYRIGTRLFAGVGRDVRRDVPLSELDIVRLDFVLHLVPHFVQAGLCPLGHSDWTKCEIKCGTK